MPEERLSQNELGLVLRRAAELDETSVGGGYDDGMPLEAVEAAAAEVGLPVTAVRQAVAELRAGLLTDSMVGVPLGPTVIVEAAVVPLDREEAVAEIGRWLSGQTFHRHRGRDGVEVWRVREDWVAGLQRRLDWSASVRLKNVREVIVRGVVVEGGTLVRLEATLAGAPAAAPGIGAAGGAVAGSLTGVGTAAAVGTGSALVMGLGAVVAGAGATGGWLAGRSLRRNRVARIADELAAELDRLAAGLTVERNALDRLRERARRHRTGNWA